MTDIIAQGLGIVGAALNIGSFQMKKNKTLITFQFLGSSFFLFNYLMLGALTGCFLNGMGVIRGLIFMQGKKLRKLPILIVLVVLLVLGTLFAEFIGPCLPDIFEMILNKESLNSIFSCIVNEISDWNNPIFVLPLVAMIVMTVAMYFDNGKVIRFAQLFVSSPCWLVYNIMSGTIGGTICEIFVIVSTTISFIRYGFNGFEK